MGVLKKQIHVHVSDESTKVQPLGAVARARGFEKAHVN